MKRKIKVVDNISNKVLEKEVEIPNSLHFEIQKKTKMGIFRDRTKYTRKRKHKGGDLDD